MKKATVCTIDGCEKWAKSRGWCTAHYERFRRHGDPTIVRVNTILTDALVTGEKLCSGCQTVLPLNLFVKNKGNRDGRGQQCRPCHTARRKEYADRNQSRVRRLARESVARRREDHERQHRYRLGVANASYWRRYGITLADYQRMVEEQNNSCAICGQAPDPNSLRNGRLHVDHDHETGQVRALLCHLCNYGIGCFRETPQHLYEAIAYLARHSTTAGATA